MSQAGYVGGPAIASQMAVNSVPLKERSVKEQAVKKPGLIKRWLYKVAEEAWNYKKSQERFDKEYAAVSISQLVKASDIEQPSLNRDKAIRFNVYIAQGGRIVEVTRYDRMKDRHVEGLYVITSDQDFGREIDKILTMEALK